MVPVKRLVINEGTEDDDVIQAPKQEPSGGSPRKGILKGEKNVEIPNTYEYLKQILENVGQIEETYEELRFVDLDLPYKWVAGTTFLDQEKLDELRRLESLSDSRLISYSTLSREEKSEDQELVQQKVESTAPIEVIVETTETLPSVVKVIDETPKAEQEMSAELLCLSLNKEPSDQIESEEPSHEEKPEIKEKAKPVEWWDEEDSFESLEEEEIYLLHPLQIQKFLEKKRLKFQEKSLLKDKSIKRKKMDPLDSDTESDEEFNLNEFKKKEKYVYDKPLSPIVIFQIGAEKTFNEPFQLINFDVGYFPQIQNDGSTILLTYADKEKRPKVKGGGLGHPEFDVHSIKFYWHSNHILNGRRYVLECQIQLIASQYDKTEDAVKHKGLACLVSFFKFSAQRNLSLSLLIPSISKIRKCPKRNFPATDIPFNISTLVPNNLDAYYRYKGTFCSHNNPYTICREETFVYYRNVISVFSEILPLTRQQLGDLTELYNDAKEIIQNNNEEMVALRPNAKLLYQGTM